MIFYDAVMYKGNLLAADVRMRVLLTRYTVGGPAGMGDSGTASKGLLGQRIGQPLYLAGHAHTFQCTLFIHHSNTCRVITAILQLAQPLDQDCHHIALCYTAYYSAHNLNPVTNHKLQAKEEG